MVDFDPANDNAGTKLTVLGGKPSIAALKAAIGGSAVTASYPAAFMMGATKNDLIHVCRLEGIPVAGLPGA